MPRSHFPKESHKFEIQTYERPKDFERLSNTHVPFTGAPQKHPYDPGKIILVADPFSTNTFYYEFRADDIVYAEGLSNLVTIEGEVVAIARVWIKKRSIAIRCTPFIVEDTRIPK